MALRSSTTTPIATTLSTIASTGDLLTDFHYFQQERDNWCWAACAKMVFDYFEINEDRQCEIAETVFAPKSCCNSRTSCDKAYWASLVFDAYSFAYRFKNSALSFQEVDQEIKADRPVEVYWKWNAGNRNSGHLVIVSGTYPPTSGGVGSLHVADPRKNASMDRMDYDEVLTAENKGAWTETLDCLNESSGC